MARVDSDGGTGRRLPQWMLGVRADDQLQRSNDVDNNKKKGLEEELDSHTSLAKGANSIRRPRKSVLHQQNEDLMEESCIPECESKKRKGRKRKSRGIDVAENAADLEAVPVKKSNRVRKKLMDSALEERKAKLKNSGSRSDDDDMELTVDDLMVIAKEYVKADEDRTRKHELYEEHESSSINQRTSYTGNQTEGSLNSNSDSKQRLLDLKTPNPHGSTAILGGEKVDINVRATGDPAKDMLDLFLGPLLKKPAEIEQPKFVTTDVQFSFDSKSRNQRDNDNVGEEISVMKKKSSLKDKVAIFLD